MCDTRLQKFRIRQEREAQRREKKQAGGRREKLLRICSRSAGASYQVSVNNNQVMYISWKFLDSCVTKIDMQLVIILGCVFGSIVAIFIVAIISELKKCRNRKRALEELDITSDYTF